MQPDEDCDTLPPEGSLARSCLKRLQAEMERREQEAEGAQQELLLQQRPKRLSALASKSELLRISEIESEPDSPGTLTRTSTMRSPDNFISMSASFISLHRRTVKLEDQGRFQKPSALPEKAWASLQAEKRMRKELQQLQLMLVRSAHQSFGPEVSTEWDMDEIRSPTSAKSFRRTQM